MSTTSEPGKESAQDSFLDEGERLSKRPRKCPGCKLMHEDHSFGDPSPFCTGPDDTLSTTVHLSLQDEERELTAQLEKLKMVESLAMESRIHKLKLEIAESQRRIEELNNLQTSKGTAVPLAHGPLENYSAALASTVNMANGATNTVPKPSGHDVLTDSPQTPLDVLLADYSGNSLHQQQQININTGLSMDSKLPSRNPDGPLSGPLAAQESAMFLKPAQLAKGEKVLRIIDYVDKIVTSTEDRTITDLGSTKLVISSGPKKAQVRIAFYSSVGRWEHPNFSYLT